LVLFAEDIDKAKTEIFTGMRDKDGWTVEGKHAYNLETVRIEKAGGDISQRKLYMMYFGTGVSVPEVQCRGTCHESHFTGLLQGNLHVHAEPPVPDRQTG